jgi:two-component system phosphate regulon sensor histidine kinase PhoR
MERSHIISLVSHEMKTPVSTISGYADIIRNGMANEETTHRYADNIFTEAMRMGKLIDDMVYILKYNNNELFPELDNKTIKKIVLRAVAKIEAQYAEKYKLDIQVSGNATSMIDEYMLEEVLFKLLENAILYGDNQHKQDATLPYASISVDISLAGTRAKIVVKDEGKGMSEECLEKACDEFYRADKRHSRSIGCNGLGLSVVKVIIAAHGGTFDIDSKEGCGTTITIVI